MYEKAIYEIIDENIENGELPEDFSIAAALGEDISYADGAYDGITLYHVGRSQLSEESMQMIDKLVHEINDDDLDAAFYTLFRFSEYNTALGSVDELEEYILDNSDWIDPTNLYNFATECLVSADIELVKFGLIIMEIFSEPSESIKDFMRRIGLCNEFTLFVIFNIITNWSNPNQEIFNLAKKTHGWGRIHAVERLQPENDEIVSWLLTEGIKNTVMPEYSAYPVFRRANVSRLLKDEISFDIFCGIAKIIDCFIEEGPTTGTFVIKNEEEVMKYFLLQVGKHRLTYDIISTVYHIAFCDRFEALKEDCRKAIDSEPAKRIVRKALREGKGFNIADFLDIYSADVIYNQMVEDFDKNFHNCGLLVKNEKYREKTLELFRNKLPIDNMKNVRSHNYGLGEEYRDYTALVMLIRELNDYPMCGVDFIKLGLISPIANNRSVALNVLGSWCRIKDCSLSELSPELAKMVESLKEKESFESSKEVFEKLGFNYSKPNK